MSAISSSSHRLKKKAKGKAKVPNVDQNAHQRRLPFEIWSLIFSYLPIEDLTCIARVSTTFLPICRFLLYRTLTLRNDNQSYPYTLNVLKHINGLASTVRHATFFTAWTPWTPGVPPMTWLDFDVLAQFTGLRTLTFIGCPFMLMDEQRRFMAMVGRCSPALKWFTYVPHYPTAFPSPVFEIRGLESVSWPSYLCALDIYFSPHRPSLNAFPCLQPPHTPSPPFPSPPARDTPLPNGPRMPTHEWRSSAYASPNLISCHIGLLYPNRVALRTRDTTEPLTAFLAAHPTLTHLALGTSAHFAHLYEGLSGRGALVGPAFLPALKSLETHPANLALMVRQGVGSLHALTRLTLAYYCPQGEGGRGEGPVAELLMALESSPGFPFVEELGVHFSGSLGETGPDPLGWVPDLGAYFPAVLSWSGHLGSVISPLALAETLAPYNLVKSVYLPYTMLASDTRPGVFQLSADDFTPIANACPQLSVLVIKTSSHQVQCAKHVLERNEDGVLVSITVNPMDQ